VELDEAFRIGEMNNSVCKLVHQSSLPCSASDCRSTAGAYAPATVDAPKINRICKGPANHRFENHGIAQGEPVSSAHHRCEALGNATA